MQIAKKELSYIKKEYNFSCNALKIAEKNLTKDKTKAEKANEFLEMARAYLKDSIHFLDKKDYLRAIAAVYYGHAWLDAGARLGFWLLKAKDKKWFSVD